MTLEKSLVVHCSLELTTFEHPLHSIQNYTLSIVWGVNPAILVNKSEDLTDLLRDSVKSSVEKGFMNKEKCYLLTAGFPTGVEGTSNLIRILAKEQIAYYLK